MKPCPKHDHCRAEGVDDCIPASFRLRVTPITQAEASEFVRTHHRHHPPLRVGYVFSVAVADEDDQVRGVAIVGRPVSQYLFDGFTLEVRRVATDGSKNACSMLYGAAWRAARALGYRQLITYTLASEPGSSLRASGWRVVARVTGQSWDAPERGRPRVDLNSDQMKLRWAAA
jgi:hypothetical protein